MSSEHVTVQSVQDLFTRKDGSYLFARWGRPIVPVVFGVEDATLSVVKGAIEAVVVLAGLQHGNEPAGGEAMLAAI